MDMLFISFAVVIIFAIATPILIPLLYRPEEKEIKYEIYREKITNKTERIIALIWSSRTAYYILTESGQEYEVSWKDYLRIEPGKIYGLKTDPESFRPYAEIL